MENGVTSSPEASRPTEARGQQSFFGYKWHTHICTIFLWYLYLFWNNFFFKWSSMKIYVRVDLHEKPVWPPPPSRFSSQLIEGRQPNVNMAMFETGPFLLDHFSLTKSYSFYFLGVFRLCLFRHYNFWLSIFFEPKICTLFFTLITLLYTISRRCFTFLFFKSIHSSHFLWLSGDGFKMGTFSPVRCVF